jgi:hypothetical protein
MCSIIVIYTLYLGQLTIDKITEDSQNKMKITSDFLSRDGVVDALSN